MSLNLGTPVNDAATALRNNPDWKTIRDAVREQVRQKMNVALSASPDKVADNVGYARALRDIYIAFEAATFGKQQTQIAPVGPEKTNAA